MTRVFSGIKPTGGMQLGNFCGAVQRWVESQPAVGSDAARRGEAIYCAVDLHAMTTPYDPIELTRRTREIATLLFAAGLDPDRALVFVQSHVGAVHAECTWILDCVATFGELRRMTQFKEKAVSGPAGTAADAGSGGNESVTMGLFNYPVLMAADILLYDTAEVPVGDDQRQHVELARDIAQRFNQRFGDTFVVPRATIPAVGARIMDLQEPTKKMSKSDDSPLGCVFVLDEPQRITKKIKSAVTDSDNEIRYDPATKPGVSNLIDIYTVAAGVAREAAVGEFAAGGYGRFKIAVADAVVEMLRPVQDRYRELAADPGEVDRLLAIGARRAEAIATTKLDQVKNRVGLLARRG